MASTFILKRKCFDMSAGGHAIPITKLKEMYKNSGFKGSFADYKTQQLGVKPEVIGYTPHQAAKVRAITQGGQAGAIDQAYNAAAANRQQNRAANKALASSDPNFFKDSNQGKGLLADQQKVQKKLDQKAIKSTGGNVSNVSGGVQTRTTPRPNNSPKPKPNPGSMTLSARWNKMGTMGKAGVITAGAGGAYLLGRSLFGGRKKD